ncbi:hypothetical protein STANM309S_05898 [Streptomyces tanashiensis]
MNNPRVLGPGGSSGGIPFWFNRDMAIMQNDTAKGRHDLEPFWPSRQHHDSTGAVDA